MLLKKLFRIEDFIKTELRQDMDNDLSGKGEVYSALDQTLLIDGNLKTDVRFLSDSVIIGARFVEYDPAIDRDTQRAFLIDILGIILSKLSMLYSESEPYLALRGCIAYDQFLIERNFLIGQAVDWAADGEKVPKGAFIFLHESAEKYYAPWHESFIVGKTAPERETREIYVKGNRICKYDMPVKDEEFKECYVLNPLEKYQSESKRAEIIDAYKR